ncbi:MAG: alpha/beta hydrolase [Pseudomonadota bacterium]
MKPKDRYLDINGLRLHYLDWGNYEHQPMLLLHGFLSHAHAWDDFALNFRSCYHVIALDQRGHGESEWPEDAAYILDNHFADIAHFVEALNLRKIILVGHSMGGRNALFYTACTPHNIERLILIDIRVGNDPLASEALRHLLDSIPLQVNSIDEIVEKVQTIYPYLSHEICSRMASYGFKQMPDGKFIPRDDIRMRQQSQQSGYLVEDLWPFLENIPCPTMLIRGKESPFLSREDAERVCKIIPNAEWEEIPRATHMPVQENPTAFNKVVSHFLDDRN